MTLVWQLGLFVLLLATLLMVWRALRAQGAKLEGLSARLDDCAMQQQLHGQSISGLTAGAIGVDRRIYRLETREQALTERQENLEFRQNDELPYDRAIRLVQQGAGSRRLIDEFDLSESEASLIVRLHGDNDDLRAADA